MLNKPPLLFESDKKSIKNDRETENMKHLMRVATDLTEKMLDEIIYPMCDM